MAALLICAVSPRLFLRRVGIPGAAFVASIAYSAYLIQKLVIHGVAQFCNSHGIALTPDDSELWLADAFNNSVHIFDARSMPPRQVASLRLRDQPGWMMFSIDGKYAYPSTGDVIETQRRTIVAELTDERARPVQSEKMVDIVFSGDQPSRAGDQFGMGRGQ